MSLKSLIFDFDGLILDTESPDVQTWQEIYREHGCEFPVHEWGRIVGGLGADHFDPVDHLARLTGRELDPPSLRLRQQEQSNRLTWEQPVLPGVTQLLDRAQRAGLALAIASSSEHAWVDRHLSRLGLLERFHLIICSDDVPTGRTKPHPDLFLKALEALHLAPPEAIVFEDSPNGVRAAKAAGIYVVAVPNGVTALLGVDGADMTLGSLEEFLLDPFLDRP
jgi:HAD superfamily hydrolase (TIGR01509 family)